MSRVITSYNWESQTGLPWFSKRAKNINLLVNLGELMDMVVDPKDALKRADEIYELYKNWTLVGNISPKGISLSLKRYISMEQILEIQSVNRCICAQPDIARQSVICPNNDPSTLLVIGSKCIEHFKFIKAKCLSCRDPIKNMDIGLCVSCLDKERKTFDDFAKKVNRATSDLWGEFLKTHPVVLAYKEHNKPFASCKKACYTIRANVKMATFPQPTVNACMILRLS